MLSARSTLGILATVACATVACHRYSATSEPALIDGVKFSAVSVLSGAAHDTLTVSISARNLSRQGRRIDGPAGCDEGISVRASLLDQAVRRATWSSVGWLLYEAVPPKGQRPRTCHSSKLIAVIRPGGDGIVAALRVPVRAILGDSLPAARYRVSARLQGNGRRAGVFDAGYVDLH